MPKPLLRLTPLESLGDAAEFLRIIAHPHRLRMLQMLRQGDFCVGELAAACDIPGPITSEHLRLMQRSRLLTSHRDGQKVFYRIADSHVRSLLQCVEQRYGTRSPKGPPPRHHRTSRDAE